MRKKTANIEQAKSLGKAAFIAGINIPIFDPRIMRMIRGRKLGDPRTNPELKAWMQGWTDENLKS